MERGRPGHARFKATLPYPTYPTPTLPCPVRRKKKTHNTKLLYCTVLYRIPTPRALSAPDKRTEPVPTKTGETRKDKDVAIVAIVSQEEHTTSRCRSFICPAFSGPRLNTASIVDRGRV